MLFVILVSIMFQTLFLWLTRSHKTIAQRSYYLAKAWVQTSANMPVSDLLYTVNSGISAQMLFSNLGQDGGHWFKGGA